MSTGIKKTAVITLIMVDGRWGIAGAVVLERDGSKVKGGVQVYELDNRQAPSVIFNEAFARFLVTLRKEDKEE